MAPKPSVIFVGKARNRKVLQRRNTLAYLFEVSVTKKKVFYNWQSVYTTIRDMRERERRGGIKSWREREEGRDGERKEERDGDSERDRESGSGNEIERETIILKNRAKYREKDIDEK